MSTNTEHEIFAEKSGSVLHVTINRPAALNALSRNMIQEMARLLATAEKDDAVGSVVIRGAGGKAFCAGGDIKSTWAQRTDVAANDHYFYDEYNLNRQLFHYSKPLVALMDGITMGGGYGVAGYCDYRVATENTKWAMPETGIGFFPDIGVTHAFHQAPGAMGMCLALTGMTIGPEDAFYGGFATHYIYADALRDVTAALDAGESPEEVVARFHRTPALIGPLAQHQDVIDRCFGLDSVAEIVEALKQETSDWAQATLALLLSRSPLAVCVTFTRMIRGRGQSFDRIIEDDYVIARQFMRGDEFFEGVRAMLVDKDKKPLWSPETLDKVTEIDISRHFEPLPGRLADGFKG